MLSSTWLSRLRLLDDLPIAGQSADLFELGPHVRLLAEAILACEGPLVVHVDGTWGRGKTSFCRLVEEELTHKDRQDKETEQLPASCSRYIASDDRGEVTTSLLYAIAKAVAGPNDPVEAARIVRQWSADSDLSAMRVDGFATWLGHELGRSKWSPPDKPIKIPLGSTSGRTLELVLRPNRRRSAVVFVDDLDRCPGERVVHVLDAIRSYVACPGLVFVIAADRRLIAQAFEQIVARDADLRHVDASEAMEKYIHRRVDLPSFRGFGGTDLARRLRAEQCRLLDAKMPYLLSIPTAEFEDGVAWQLTQRFGASLTPRRLKRILNDVAIDMAGFVDDAGLVSVFEDDAQWRDLWSTTKEDSQLEPVYVRGLGTPRRGELRGYFVGRVLVRVAEHMWPSLFGRLDHNDDEFVRRTERLLALAWTHGQWTTANTKRMRDELLAGLDPVETTSLQTRRQLCEFMATVLEATREASGWSGAQSSAPIVEEAALETLRQVVLVPGNADIPSSNTAFLTSQDGHQSLDLLEELVAELDDPTLDPHTRREQIKEILLLLEELAFDDQDTVSAAVNRVLKLPDYWLTEHYRYLWPVARSIANRGFDKIANDLYDKVRDLNEVAQTLPLKSKLDLDVEYLKFLIERRPNGEQSISKASGIVMYWSRAGRDMEKLDLFQVWLNAATLHGQRPGQPFPWLNEWSSELETTKQRYIANGGRDPTRRYLFLLRAAGKDDPVIDELFGTRATLIDPKRGDAEIIEALADIVVRRGDLASYARARELYVRLKDGPRWTPEVIHNLATAEYALNEKSEHAGYHWLEAYRRAPSNTVIRRAFRRYLNHHGYNEEALLVSRGEPLPANFNPFKVADLTGKPL